MDRRQILDLTKYFTGYQNLFWVQKIFTVQTVNFTPCIVWKFCPILYFNSCISTYSSCKSHGRMKRYRFMTMAMSVTMWNRFFCGIKIHHNILEQLADLAARQNSHYLVRNKVFFFVLGLFRCFFCVFFFFVCETQNQSPSTSFVLGVTVQQKIYFFCFKNQLFNVHKN